MCGIINASCYEKLKHNIIDLMKEEQAKLGYYKGIVRLYYPLKSLNHFFRSDVDETVMRKLLQSFAEYAQDELGKIKITNQGERFCNIVPDTGAEYVHELMKEDEFILQLVKLVSSHGCTIDQIIALFQSFSDQVIIQKMNHDEFDYLIRFEDLEDDYYYCFKQERCHISYHRFTREDYEDFQFDE